MGSRVQNLNSTVSRMALWWYNNGMNNDKNDIAKVLADNIAYYRKKLNLTQLELAEKLNYSDKSISKWERAEGVPDIYVLRELSLFFGVPIDALVSKRKQPFSLLKNKFILAYFYASIFLVIGVALFGILNLLDVDYENWKVIVYSSVFSSLTLFIFYLVWKIKLAIYSYLTTSVWLLAFSITLIVNQPGNYWVYIITAPVYALLLFLIYILYHKKHK